MKKFVYIFIVLLVLILIAGCGAQSAKSTADMASTEMNSSVAYEAEYAASAGDGGMPESAVPVDEEYRKIIKNAELTIEVDNLEDKVKEIENEVIKYGGYLGESNIHKNSSSLWAHMVLRLPASEFEGFIEYLEDLGVIKSRRIYRDDVTSRFIDMEARLKVLKAEETSLLGILEKASMIEDVLNIRKELRNLRSDIEALEGELKYLTEKVDYSTINISLHQARNPETHIDAQGLSGIWQKGASAFTRSVNIVLNFTGDFIVFLIGAIPILIPIAALVGGAIHFRKKHKKRHMDKPKS